MPKKEYLVKLTDEERTTLLTLTKKGTIARTLHALRGKFICGILAIRQHLLCKAECAA